MIIQPWNIMEHHPQEHLHPSSHPPRLLALTSCPTSSTSRKRGRAAGHAELAELEEIFRAELCWPKAGTPKDSQSPKKWLGNMII